MLSYYKPKFIEKILWESGFSNFGKNRNENRLFGRHFETVHFFCWNRVLISVHIHGVND